MMGRPEPLISAALLVMAVVLVALIIAVLALPGIVRDDVAALTMLWLSLLLVVAIIAATVWG